MAKRYRTRLYERKCLEEPSSTPTLPAEIFVDILSRLPVEAMTQCKSVCKSWRDLLSTPYFAHLHFAKAKPSSLLFCHCSGNKTKLYCCHIHSSRSSNINNAMVSMPTKFKLPKNTFRGKVVGSSNGLLCLSEIHRMKKKFYICNPITGEYVGIAGPKVEQGWHVFEPIGFFYNPQNQQCKILMPRVRVGYGNFPGSGQIFTLGSNSWRNIDIPGHLHLIRAVPLNGSLHWISTRDDRHISSFDMENEQALSIALPDQVVMHTASLAGLGNFLCIFDNEYPEFNIWVMKEYGVEESWKHYTVKRSPNSHYRPVAIKEDASILLIQNSETLISYDPKTKESRALYDQIGDRRFVYIHTPSLVPLKDILIGAGHYKILNVRKRKRCSTINFLEF